VAQEYYPAYSDTVPVPSLDKLHENFFPRHIWFPIPNWSFLYCFKVICTSIGDVRLSNAMSDNSKSVD